jgi:colanic acid/amylovoran biosynthesis protein
MESTLNPDSAWRAGYLPLMTSLARRLSERGFNPLILNHAGREDDAVCDALRRAIGAPAVIDEGDPLAVKGIIGAAAITVCSRYHGCTSAMSEGVLCVGTAWSHKYAALFDDFGMGPYLLTRCDEASGLQILEQLLSVPDVARSRLNMCRRVLEEQVDAMWQDVLTALRK